MAKEKCAKLQLLFLHILHLQYTRRHHLGRGSSWISAKSIWGSSLKGISPRAIGNAPDETADGCQDLLMWLRTSVCSWTHTLASRGQELSTSEGAQWSQHTLYLTKGLAGLWRKSLKGQIEIVEIWLILKIILNLNRNVKDLQFILKRKWESYAFVTFCFFSKFCIGIFDSIRYVIRIMQRDTQAWKENCLEI